MTFPWKPFIGSLAAVSVLSASAVAFAQPMQGGEGAGGRFADRPAPSQECLNAMVDMQEAQLDNFDSFMAQHKSHLQESIADLSAVAAIADDEDRKAAMKALHDERMGAERPEPPAAVTAAMDAVKDVCGEMRGFGPGSMGMGMRSMRGGPGGRNQNGMGGPFGNSFPGDSGQRGRGGNRMPPMGGMMQPGMGN
jgi:hypothetical protein